VQDDRVSGGDAVEDLARRPPVSRKFSVIASNQSTAGHEERIVGKCAVRRPTPMPRSGIPSGCLS